MFIPYKRQTLLGPMYGRCSCKPLKSFKVGNKVIVVSCAVYKYIGCVGFIEAIDFFKNNIYVKYDRDSEDRVGYSVSRFQSNNLDLYTDHVKITR